MEYVSNSDQVDMFACVKQAAPDTIVPHVIYVCFSLCFQIKKLKFSSIEFCDKFIFIVL